MFIVITNKGDVMAYITAYNVSRFSIAFFARSETELDYYLQKVSVRVTLRAPEQLETLIPGKLEISRKSLKCL